MPGTSRPSAGTVVVVVEGGGAAGGAVVVVGGAVAVGPVAAAVVSGVAGSATAGLEFGIGAASPRRPLEHPVRATRTATPAADQRAVGRAPTRAAAGERPNGRRGFSCGPPVWRPTGRGWPYARPRT